MIRKSTVAVAAAALALGAPALAQGAQLLSDGGFEATNIGPGNYTYPGLPYGTIAPIGATQGGWTFAGSALVNGSSSNAWYGGAAPAGIQGSQFAALQATSSLSQSFTADSASLQLSWLAAGRPWGMGDQSYQVLLDGAAVGGVFSTVSDAGFAFQSLMLTGLTSGSIYNLAFQGLATSDDTAFLDGVSLSSSFASPPAGPPTVTYVGPELPLPADQVVVVDFDNPTAPGFDFVQGPGAYVRSGALGLDPGMSAPPPGDVSNYETVLGGGFATLTSLSLLSSVSFYMGSPDSFNAVQFLGPNGYDFTLAGDQLWAFAAGGGTGDQTWGRRVSYDFGGYRVNQVVFKSSGNSFEFDGIAAAAQVSSAAVPEPATWALLILGFGTMGAVLRRQRRALAA